MIQLELNCPVCEKPLCFLLPNDNTHNLICRYCATEFGKSSPASGFLYALKNDSMPGLLKIGYTTRSVADRVSELNSSTATPTPFEIVFYFACNEPQSDEALAHESLVKHRINQNREFFKITGMEALSILKEKLFRQEIFFNDKSGDKSCKPADEIDTLDELLLNEVLTLRESWSTTGGASKGISLLYRLMSEHRYSSANKIVSLFLSDNPAHTVALRLSEEIKVKIKQEKNRINHFLRD